MVLEKPRDIRIALVGQPNSGKSTLFNSVAGFKVNTGNFSGTTVTFAETRVLVGTQSVTLVDLPGTYSMTSLDLAEKVTRDYLLAGKVDVIINVLDASMLARSLELTLQLIEMGVPMVVALNMVDDAKRKGIAINTERFSTLTGLQVCELVAVQGIGVREVFSAAVAAAKREYQPVRPIYDRDVESCIASIVHNLPQNVTERLGLDSRFLATRLLDCDRELEVTVDEADHAFLLSVQVCRKQLAEMHGWPEDSVFASHRHALVLNLYEQVAVHRHGSARGLREWADGLLINPITGAIAVLSSLFLMFWVSFWLGDHISGLLASPFASLHAFIESLPGGIVRAILSGLSDGVEAGAGIVLPYLIPLLFLLAVYEDTGLLPRIAFMVDGILHRVGLHGKSVIPLILGYGCNVPALMACRNLESERERRQAMLIIPFITCSARTVVILGLVGRYLGAAWATLVYVGSIAVAMLVSYLLSRLNVDLDKGIIMEVPPLRVPPAKILLKKVWWRLYEFLVRAWPIILVSSIVLSVVSLYGVDDWVNWFFSPFTVVAMKLPMTVGIALFLGIFRKELALAMLATALGTTDVGSVLSSQQLLTLTVFTVLYIPCLATLTTLRSEGGLRLAATSAALNFGVAVVVATLVAWV